MSRATKRSNPAPGRWRSDDADLNPRCVEADIHDVVDPFRAASAQADRQRQPGDRLVSNAYGSRCASPALLRTRYPRRSPTHGSAQAMKIAASARAASMARGRLVAHLDSVRRRTYRTARHPDRKAVSLPGSYAHRASRTCRCCHRRRKSTRCRPPDVRPEQLPAGVAPGPATGLSVPPPPNC
jgi:hypothetical protein